MTQENTKICDTCGTENSARKQFCTKCGNPLEDTHVVPSYSRAAKTPPIRSSKTEGFLDQEMQLSPDEDTNTTLILPNQTLESQETTSLSPPFSGSQPSPPPTTPRPETLSSGFRPTRNVIIGGIIIVLLLLLILVPTFSLLHTFYVAKGTPTPSVPTLPPHSIPANGIGVFRDQNGEDIGVSDGTFALDVGPQRPASDLKMQASSQLQQGNVGSATALWKSALDVDSSDAEALIYLEDQRVISSGHPWETIVIGSVLTSHPVDYASRDQLQGAYVAQREYNQRAYATSGSLLIRLLIAKSGNNALNSIVIARQIVQAADTDKTIIGVLGWTKSTSTLNALPIFVNAHIPLLASTAGADELTGRSAYFFRVTPPNKAQAGVLVKYTEKNLNPQRLIVFEDPNDTFSQNLAADFVQQFNADGYKVLSTETYKTASPSTEMSRIVQQALAQKPNVIFFAGSRATDIGNVLAAIPQNAQFANLKFITDSSFYPIVDAPTGQYPLTTRVYFVSAAFPDEWSLIKPPAQTPAFFKEYPQAFDPNNLHTRGNPYSYRRANAYVMLAYDGLITLFKGIEIARAGGKQMISPDDLQHALTQIHGKQAVQGITGQISFSDNHDPTNKEIVMLHTDVKGLRLVGYQNCFLIQDCL